MKGVNRYVEFVLTVFVKKNLIWGKWAILGAKVTRPHNSGSTLKDLFEILHNERTKRYMELMLMVFLKKFSFVTNGRPFLAENGTSS